MSMLGGLPPPRPDQAYNPPAPPGPVGGAAGVLRARTVIISGPNGGIFVYSGAQRAGNLIASVTAANGVDAHGNAVLGGVVFYDPVAFLAIQMGAGGVTALAWWAAPSQAGPYSNVAEFILRDQNELDLLLAGTGPGLGQFVMSNHTLAGARTSALVEAQGSLAVGPSLGNIREWYAPSGADDFAALDTALSSYGSADLLPGTYELSAELTVGAATLQGCDMATLIKPFGAYAGALFAAGSKGVIRNLGITNSLSDAITVAGGITNWWLTDLYFASNAGWCVNGTLTGPAHGRIRSLRGESGASANGGGVNLDGGTGAAVTGEVNIYDLDIQACPTTEVLRVQGLTDILVNKVNGSTITTTPTPAMSILGACQTVHLLGVDVGVTVTAAGIPAGAAVLSVGAGASANSPTDIRVTGKLQAGARDLIVSDAVSRSRFEVDCTRAQLDGAQFTGTGQGNKLIGMFNGNSASGAGAGSDVNVTNSVHLFIDAPQYGAPGGGLVAANLTVAAGNHVTHSNPPAGSTVAGVPNGW